MSIDMRTNRERDNLRETLPIPASSGHQLCNQHDASHHRIRQFLGFPSETLTESVGGTMGRFKRPTSWTSIITTVGVPQMVPRKVPWPKWSG